MSGKKWADATEKERRRVAQQAQDAYASLGTYLVATWGAQSPAEQETTLSEVDDAIADPAFYDSRWSERVREALRANGFEVPDGD